MAARQSQDTTMPATFTDPSRHDGRIQLDPFGKPSDVFIENAMAPKPGQPVDSSKVHSPGTQRVMVGAHGADWSKVLDAPQSFNTSDLSNGETDPVLATAHNGFRSVSGTELRPQDYVRIEGMETTVAAAVTSGYLKPAANGRGYEATAKGRAAAPAAQSQAPAQASQAAQSNPELDAHERTLEASRKQMGEIEDAVLARADPHGDLAHLRTLPLNASIGMLVAAQREKPLLPTQLSVVATSWGVTVPEAEARINAISNAMGGQFRAMARLVDVEDPEAAAKWITRTKGNDTAMSVLVAHGTRGDARAWLPLLRDYKRAGGK